MHPPTTSPPRSSAAAAASTSPAAAAARTPSTPTKGSTSRGRSSYTSPVTPKAQTASSSGSPSGTAATRGSAKRAPKLDTAAAAGAESTEEEIDDDATPVPRSRTETPAESPAPPVTPPASSFAARLEALAHAPEFYPKSAPAPVQLAPPGGNAFTFAPPLPTSGGPAGPIVFGVGQLSPPAPPPGFAVGGPAPIMFGPGQLSPPSYAFAPALPPSAAHDAFLGPAPALYDPRYQPPPPNGYRGRGGRGGRGTRARGGRGAARGNGGFHSITRIPSFPPQSSSIDAFGAPSPNGSSGEPTSPDSVAPSAASSASDLTATTSTVAAVTSGTAEPDRERPRMGTAPASIEHRLAQRQKQLDYGKNTLGYQNYLAAVPKEQRLHHHPRTPDKYQNCSSRSWMGQLRQWRRQLHQWDTAGGQFEHHAPSTFTAPKASPLFAMSDVSSSSAASCRSNDTWSISGDSLSSWDSTDDLAARELAEGLDTQLVLGGPGLGVAPGAAFADTLSPPHHHAARQHRHHHHHVGFAPLPHQHHHHSHHHAMGGAPEDGNEAGDELDVGSGDAGSPPLGAAFVPPYHGSNPDLLATHAGGPETDLAMPSAPWRPRRASDASTTSSTARSVVESITSSRIGNPRSAAGTSEHSLSDSEIESARGFHYHDHHAAATTAAGTAVDDAYFDELYGAEAAGDDEEAKAFLARIFGGSSSSTEASSSTPSRRRNADPSGYDPARAIEEACELDEAIERSLREGNPKTVEDDSKTPEESLERMLARLAAYRVAVEDAAPPLSAADGIAWTLCFSHTPIASAGSIAVTETGHLEYAGTSVLDSQPAAWRFSVADVTDVRRKYPVDEPCFLAFCVAETVFLQLVPSRVNEDGGSDVASALDVLAEAIQSAPRPAAVVQVAPPPEAVPTGAEEDTAPVNLPVEPATPAVTQIEPAATPAANLAEAMMAELAAATAEYEAKLKEIRERYTRLASTTSTTTVVPASPSAPPPPAPAPAPPASPEKCTICCAVAPNLVLEPCGHEICTACWSRLEARGLCPWDRARVDRAVSSRD
ncbi:hypothetical protein H9P43_000363 [Blastocladiella emersonii ATCC 22665]|nr:hypothetical protein H9P43_000363 [Blastocladiella emersonii ATCC 22665]